MFSMFLAGFSFAMSLVLVLLWWCCGRDKATLFWAFANAAAAALNLLIALT